MTKLLSNPNTQLLIKTFDLAMPQNTKTLHVTEYYVENGFIIIEEIEVLDAHGNFVKHADMDRVVDHLSDYIVTFKSKG